MHGDHPLLRASHQSVFDAIGLLDALPLFWVLESFSLNPGDVENVGFGKDLVEALASFD